MACDCNSLPWLVKSCWFLIGHSSAYSSKSLCSRSVIEQLTGKVTIVMTLDTVPVLFFFAWTWDVNWIIRLVHHIVYICLGNLLPFLCLFIGAFRIMIIYRSFAALLYYMIIYTIQMKYLERSCNILILLSRKQDSLVYFPWWLGFVCTYVCGKQCSTTMSSLLNNLF